MDAMEAIYPFMTYNHDAQNNERPLPSNPAPPTVVGNSITITWNPSDNSFTERNIGKIGSYLLSQYAFTCMAMAVILNRTSVFAATRRPSPLSTSTRVFLHGSAVLFLFWQLKPLVSGLLYNNSGYIQHYLQDLWEKHVSSTIAAATTTNTSTAVNATASSVTEATPSNPIIISLAAYLTNLYPSLHSSFPSFFSVVQSILSALSKWTGPVSSPTSPKSLWWVYLAICYAHCIETFCGSLQARPITTDTGLTLFEYSVIFHDAQAYSFLPNELLVLALCACVSHLSLHLQAVFNSYRFRLYVSTLFSASFLSYFAWSIYCGNVFKFPAICIVGYFPQLLMCVVVLICLVIYGLARWFSGSPPENMRNSLQSVHLDPSDDFYTCLMKFGTIALSSATRATYLSENKSLYLPRSTWVESGYANEVTEDTGGRPTGDASLGGLQSHPGSFAQSIRVRLAVTFRLIRGTFILISSVLWKTLLKGFAKVGYKDEESSGIDGNQSNGSALPLDDWDSNSDLSLDQTIDAIRNKMVYGKFDSDDQTYPDLLLNDDLPEVDNSADYDEGTDTYLDDSYEYNSEYESDAEDLPSGGSIAGSFPSTYIDAVQDARQGSFNQSIATYASSSSPRYMSDYELLAGNLSEIMAQSSSHENSAILASHMSRDLDSAPITRRRYRETVRDETKDLVRMITERRKGNTESTPSEPSTVCVVCQSSPRQIVLWPCRCFAICEECRITLAFKHFKGCVCCRRPVESFSRVYVP